MEAINPTEAPVAETPKETPVPMQEVPVPEDKFGPKFAALSKKEKEIKRLQMEIKQKEQMLSEKEKTYKTWEEKKSKARENPLDYLNDANLTYDDLTQYYLNGKKPTAETKVGVLETKIDQLEKKLQEKLQEEENLKKQTKVTEYKGSIKTFIKSNAGKFEALSEIDEGADVVYNLIDQHYQETENELEFEEACEKAEAYLEEWGTEQLSKMLKIKKFKAKIKTLLGSEEEPPKAEVKPTSNEKKPTLTNELSQNLPSRSEKAMSDRERLKKAAELIKFT